MLAILLGIYDTGIDHSNHPVLTTQGRLLPHISLQSTLIPPVSTATPPTTSNFPTGNTPQFSSTTRDSIQIFQSLISNIQGWVPPDIPIRSGSHTRRLPMLIRAKGQGIICMYIQIPKSSMYSKQDLLNKENENKCPSNESNQGINGALTSFSPPLSPPVCAT